MTISMLVEKAASLRYPAFGKDLNDPSSTVYAGKNLEELTLELVPDPAIGGRGSMTLQINDPEWIGQFKPGDRVTVCMVKES